MVNTLDNPRLCPEENPRYSRGVMGLVILGSDQTIQEDAQKLISKFPGLGYRFSLAPMNGSSDVSLEHYKEMKGNIAIAASQFLPQGGIDTMGFACTSCGITLGHEAIKSELLSGHPSAKFVTSMGGSVCKAMKTMSFKKICLVTPYLKSLSEEVEKYFAQEGFEIVYHGCMNLQTDEEIYRVEPSYIIEAARSCLNECATDVDGILVSCSGLRSVEVVDEIEQRTGKPTVVSTQCMLWDMIRSININDQIKGYGKLFREH